MIRTNTINEPLALWSSRFSLFAVTLLVVALVLHRFVLLSTPVALTTTGVAFAASALGIAAGIIAGISIWARGRTGAMRAAAGIVLGGLLWLWPLAYMAAYTNLPRINDVSTDTASPPPFNALAKARPEGANRAAYGGEVVARQQGLAYPDLRTVVVDRSADEVYDLALLVARGRRGMGWKVLTEEPPSLRPPRAGFIEATERTTILGFTDDVVIRVSGSETEARIDVRSASRYGRHDLGANASRIRRFLRELQARLEATTPGSIAARGIRGGRPQAGVAQPGGVKRPLGRSPETKAGKGGQDPAPRDARRAPAPKAQPRG